MDGFTAFPDGTRWEINRGENERWLVNNPGSFISGRGGLDYHINNQNILSFSYRFMQGTNNNHGNLFTRMMNDEGVIFSSFQQYHDSYNRWENHNLTLNYQHIFDSANQRQFFIDASWVRTTLSGGGDNNIIFFNGDIAGNVAGSEPITLEVRLPSDIFSARFDLEFPINRETRIETGLRYSFVNNDNRQRYYDRLLDTVILNHSMSDHYIYSEHISAAYVQVNHSFSPRFSVEAGLRFEHTALRGESRTIDSIHTNRYFGFFPSLNVNKMLTDRSGLNFSYSRRLTRPSYMLLNPIIIRNQAFAFVQGNPYLDPQISHIFRLRYSFNHMPILTFAYERSDGDIHSITHFRGDTAFSQPQNIGATNRFGLGVTFQRMFFERWRFVTSIDGSYLRSSVRYEENGEWETRSQYRGWAWIGNEITILPTMSMDVNAWGQLPSRGLFSTNRTMYSVDIGIRKSFFDRSLTARISVNDVFNTASRWTNDTRLPTGQHSRMEHYWASRSISFNLSYRFGRGNVVTARQRRDAAAEEAGRMGGGGEGGGGMGGM